MDRMAFPLTSRRGLLLSRSAAVNAALMGALSDETRRGVGSDCSVDWAAGGLGCSMGRDAGLGRRAGSVCWMGCSLASGTGSSAGRDGRSVCGVAELGTVFIGNFGNWVSGNWIVRNWLFGNWLLGN